MSKKRAKTAEEAMSEFRADPKFRRMQDERATRRRSNRERYSRLGRPILEEIRALGYDVQSLDDLVVRHGPLPEEVSQILIEWVDRLSDARLLETVVRAVSASGSPVDGRPLARCFEQTSDEGVKYAVVNSVAMTRPHSIDEWILGLADSPWGATLRSLRRDE